MKLPMAVYTILSKRIDFDESMARKFVATDSRLSVGCGGIEYQWRAESFRALRRCLESGCSLLEAEEAAKSDSESFVIAHNDRRPNDIHWQRWPMCVHCDIETMIRDLQPHLSPKAPLEERLASAALHAMTEILVCDAVDLWNERHERLGVAP